jgi:hypothetical protein
MSSLKSDSKAFMVLFCVKVNEDKKDAFFKMCDETQQKQKETQKGMQFQRFCVNPDEPEGMGLMEARMLNI